MNITRLIDLAACLLVLAIVLCVLEIVHRLRFRAEKPKSLPGETIIKVAQAVMHAGTGLASKRGLKKVCGAYNFLLFLVPVLLFYSEATRVQNHESSLEDVVRCALAILYFLPVFMICSDIKIRWITRG